jgi:hypothetical protein
MYGLYVGHSAMRVPALIVSSFTLYSLIVIFGATL